VKFEDLEQVYEALAEAIDRAGAQSEVYLAKLVLMLANDGQSPDAVLTAIENCLYDLSQ